MDRPFEHDRSLLESCAQSSVANYIRHMAEEVPGKRTNNDDWSIKRDPDDAADASCILMLNQYMHHYQRQYPDQDVVLQKQPNGQYRIGKNVEAFLRNVIFVFEHNHSENEKEAKKHRVTLNRFSSEPETPAGLLQKEATTADDNFWTKPLLLHVRRRLGEESEDDHVVSTIHLESMDDILQVAAEMGIGKGSMSKLHKHKPANKNQQTYQLYPDAIEVPTAEYVEGYRDFETPPLQQEMNGALLSIKRNRSVRKHEYFATHLNWATTENPDGVPLVHPAFDQGECGSCWAFSAAGSLETSAARREAFLAFHEYPTHHDRRRNLQADNISSNTTSEHEMALRYARIVEQNAFQLLNLSVQELIDCDTAADQGCTGGNPLLAFYFLHKYGLTSWQNYPYVGYEDTCDSKIIKHPVATVKSWGIISPNHENHMELALRHIGPVAVGFNGADKEFLSYDGGIFYKHHCEQGANHALLVVGYGEEEETLPDGNVTLTKYWIARNSWGRGWGEDGMVRVRRGDGKKGTPGTCGIARSPSVALGGTLSQRFKSNDLRGGIVGDNSTAIYDLMEESRNDGFCSRIGFGFEGPCLRFSSWVDNHWAHFLGMLGVLVALIAMWPLTAECRARRRRRLLRQRLRLEGEHKKPADAVESTSLLVQDETGDHSYGTTGVA